MKLERGLKHQDDAVNSIVRVFEDVNIEKTSCLTNNPIIDLESPSILYNIEKIQDNNNIPREMKSNVDETLGTINDGLGMITAYVTNGPKWVVTKLNSYIGLVIDKSQAFIGSQAEKIENIKQTAISNIAETVGKVAADKINNAAISVAKDNVAKAEKLMVTVQLKAMGLISKAMMMIRELTGIAVPIKLPKLELKF